MEHDDLRRKNQEIIDAFDQKVKAHTQTQRAYDALKKKMLQSNLMVAAEDTIDTALHTAIPSSAQISHRTHAYPPRARLGHIGHMRQGSDSSGNTPVSHIVFQPPSRTQDQASVARDADFSGFQHARTRFPAPKSGSTRQNEYSHAVHLPSRDPTRSFNMNARHRAPAGPQSIRQAPVRATY